MRKYFGLALLILSMNSYSNILIIGDSHTAGPFGEKLHKLLTEKNPDKNIATYGHSSSAPLHWWKDSRNYYLSGGMAHHFSARSIYNRAPAPHWRSKVLVPKLKSIFEKPLLHSEWEKMLDTSFEIETIVLALGANDRSAIAHSNGTRTAEFETRKAIIDEILNELSERSISCIWIAPPHSIKRTDALVQTSYEYIEEAVRGRCPIYDSRKFVAKYCDGVHFNCSRAMETAKTWASEVSEFINSNL